MFHGFGFVIGAVAAAVIVAAVIVRFTFVVVDLHNW